MQQIRRTGWLTKIMGLCAVHGWAQYPKFSYYNDTIDAVSCQVRNFVIIL